MPDAPIICETCVALCYAGTGGDGEVKRCDPCHKYWKAGKELVSVSRVIEVVYPKKSWDGVDPAVIDNARERGARVDRYLAEYIRTGNVTTDDGEREDVLERLDIVIPWWDANVHDFSVSCQVIVSDGRVAGTADFLLMSDRFGSDRVLDLKCTAAPEKTWALQVGAYSDLHVEPVSSCAVLHVSPKRYKSGVKLIEYDYSDAVKWWRAAKEWYFAMREIEAA